MESSTPKSASKEKSKFRSFLDGTVLTREQVLKQLPFIAYLTFIAIVYIGNNYHSVKILRDVEHLEKEVKNMRSESITLQSELMYLRRQNEITKLLQKHQIELNDSDVPPQKIEIGD